MQYSNDTYPKMYLYKRIVQAKVHIDAHYAHKIDLEGIAREACFSQYHFLRLFKKTYGVTPRQYLIRVRLEHAKELLRRGHLVSDVCFAVGFDSVGSFSSLFKRIFGLAPSSFQVQQQCLAIRAKEMPLQFIPQCFAVARGWVK